MCVVIHAAKIIRKKVKCKLLEVKLQSCLFFFLRLLQKCDKRCNSPSKIEGAGGSMNTPALPYSSD